MAPKKGKKAQTEPRTRAKRGEKPRKPRPKEKAASEEAESSEGSEESETEMRDPRLTAPRKEFSGSEADRGKYRNWKRSVVLWRKQYTKATDHQLGAKLMETVTGEAEELVFESLPEGDETYVAVVEVMDKAYGDKGLPETLEAQTSFDEFARGKLTLQTFLTKYKTLRAKAVRYGHQVSEKTDGAKLLSKSELTATQYQGVVQAVRLEAKVKGEVYVTPAYEPTMEALESLAQTLTVQDQAKGLRKRDAAALVAGQGPQKWPRKGDKGDGKGKGQWKGKGKGQWKDQQKGGGKGTCWQYANTGKCKFEGSCKFQHGPKEGKAKGKGKGECWFHKEGKCTRGENCKFSHGEAAKREAPPPRPAGE